MNNLSTNKHQHPETLVKTINARDVHAYLDVGCDFSTWIKRRIEKYGFIHNIDYITTVLKIGKKRNVIVTEYHLSIDMAKEICMVEKGEKGKQVRQYFIEAERLYRAINDEKSLAEVLQHVVQLEEEKQRIGISHIVNGDAYRTPSKLLPL